jgi:hypothetical protein
MFSQWFKNNGEESKKIVSSSLNKVETQPINITNYQQTFIPCFTKKGDLRIAIRNYEYNSEPYFLAVDPYTFQTECEPTNHYNHRKVVDGTIGYYTKKEIESTPYVAALTHFTSPPYQLQNYGLTHATHPVNGAFLTIDMCPSVKPFESSFFEKLTSYSSNEATPIAICMTGLWMLGHADEFNWLTEKQNEGKLKITWVNHSFSHVYYADLTTKNDLEKNFLLSPETNQEHELMTIEQLLIKNHQTPSVFFRAPGLVTNESLIKKLNRFGLIPLGSDAWLAKEEEPKDGSIILVHGNSNEHPGIEKAMKLLEEHRFKFFPLADAVKIDNKALTDDLTKSCKM